MNFFKNVLATIVGIFIFLFISFFVLMIVGVILSASGSNSSIKTKTNSVIDLDLTMVTDDYGGRTYIEDFQFSDQKSDGLFDVINAIEYAKTDDRIKGIKLFNPRINLGLTQSKELREKLEEFKKTGKFVVAYADAYSQGTYYLSSIADTVYVNPVGEFDFRGLVSQIPYFKEFQDKTGIEMQVIRHGKYKSAGEPFLQQNMSAENREQTSEMLNSIWHTMVTDISETRNISVDSLNSIASNLGARTPELALQKKFVDKIAYVDEFENGIKNALDVNKDKEYNEIKILDYVTEVKSKFNSSSTKDAIAVIYAQGEIRGGEGNTKIIGEGSINRALIKARNDDNIKAVVLRVNSPGGSVLTSDLILREVDLTREVKPVIVSMGDVAASGGYYIASRADHIFAEPTTITGSIGVFGMIPNLEKLANKWGINVEEVKTHQHAGYLSVMKELTPEAEAEIQESIARVYDTFITHVAEGRNMTKEQVDEIGQGRIWTGDKALSLGLVDELGGLEDAIEYAAAKVELDKYKVLAFPEYEISFSELIADLLGVQMKVNHKAMMIEQIGKDNYEMLERMNYLNQAQGIQAIMPYQLNIH